MPSPARSSSEESKLPTADEVDEFIQHNKVDERAAQDLRECPPEVQKRVLCRGDLNSARNPSAAVLVRIRDARVEERPSSRAPRPMGLPSSAEINGYIKTNRVNESAAAALRSCSPTMKRAVLSSGDVIGAYDPSAALIAKIKDIKAGGSGNVALAPPGMPPPMPSAEDIDAFIDNNDLDESAEAQLKACPPYVIALVLSKGDLRGTRNPSSAVLSRIRDAKATPPPMHPAFPPFLPPPPFGYPPHMPGYPPMYPPPPGYGPPGYYPPGYPPGPYGPPPGPYGAPEPNGQPCSEYSYSQSPGRESRSRSRKSRSRSRKKEKEKKEKKEKKDKKEKKEKKEKTKAKEKKVKEKEEKKPKKDKKAKKEKG